MKLTIEWMSQLRDAAGAAQQVLECPDTCHLTQALELALAELPTIHSDPLRSMVMPNGHRHSAILVAVDGVQIACDADPILSDGATILLSSPIAGG